MKKSIRSIRKGSLRKSTSNVDVETNRPQLSIRISNKPTKISPIEMVVIPEIIDDVLVDRFQAELASIPKDHWLRWHKNSHWILDEEKPWRDFLSCWKDICSKVETTFQMSIHASRLNRFSEIEDHKPFHHDASAIVGSIARKQNTSVVISIGCEKPVRFFHSGTRATMDFVIPSGGAYGFGHIVNKRWMHGIGKGGTKERISIAFWGWS